MTSSAYSIVVSSLFLQAINASNAAFSLAFFLSIDKALCQNSYLSLAGHFREHLYLHLQRCLKVIPVHLHAEKPTNLQLPHWNQSAACSNSTSPLCTANQTLQRLSFHKLCHPHLTLPQIFHSQWPMYSVYLYSHCFIVNHLSTLHMLILYASLHDTVHKNYEHCYTSN